MNGVFLRVLLVQSPVGRREAPIYPIGLAYLAGALDSHKCFGIDLSLKEFPGEALKAKLDSVKPDLVAVSVRNIDDSSYPNTHRYLDSFAEVMEILGSWKGTVIAGGAGFSIYPEKILELWPRIDFALVGVDVYLEQVTVLRFLEPRALLRDDRLLDDGAHVFHYSNTSSITLRAPSVITILSAHITSYVCSMCP